MRWRRRRLLLSVLVGLPFLVRPAEGQAITTLHVVEPDLADPDARARERGFPVGRTPVLTDPSAFFLRDADRRLVVPFKTLSRWGADRAVGTAPLKWMLATFRPTVGPNATVKLQLKRQGVPRRPAEWFRRTRRPPSP